MLISLAKPQMDMVLSRDNVFTSAAAAAALSPWCFHLNQINIARLLGQQRTPDMSFHPMSLKHGLPSYGSGYYPDDMEPQDTGNNSVSELVGDEPPAAAASCSSRSSASSHVSHYSASTAEPRTSCYPSTAGVLGSPYWQPVPDGLPGLASFTPHGGDLPWEAPHHGMGPPMLEYGQYTLGVHASMVPQTVFRPGATFHGLSLAPVPEKDVSSTDSKLFASSDMLNAMVLSDEPSQPSWPAPAPGAPAEYDARRCVSVSGPGVVNSSSTWTEPGAADGKTISPKMLRIRPTPTPTSSCESMRTSFLSSVDHQALTVVQPLPSQAHKQARPTGKGRRRLLPGARGQQTVLPSRDKPTRRSPACSDPPSPTKRLTRLRPKHKPGAPPTPLFSQPSGIADAVAAASAGPATAAAARGRGGRVDSQAERMSKDEFLLTQKQLGKTYKQIRLLGGFKEAESTLRGRYRTLTKSREARVRRPEWSAKDLRLLEKGVRALTPSLTPFSFSSAPTSSASNQAPASAFASTSASVSASRSAASAASGKVPWKKVAEYIVAHGGSYHFGNSTCRKRWDELVREQAARGKSVREWFFDVQEGEEGEDSMDVDLEMEGDLGFGMGLDGEMGAREEGQGGGYWEGSE